MIGRDPPATVMDPPNLLPSTPTLPVEMAGFASTDGVRSSEFYPVVSLQKCLILVINSFLIIITYFINLIIALNVILYSTRVH